MDFLKELNTNQYNAATDIIGPSLIIAGAGSGKTRVLTYRIAYLLANGIKAERILALTFTNKAANEMKERIGLIVGKKHARNIWMGTFHSIFARILRFNAQYIGYSPKFSIYDTDDSKSLIKSIIKDLNFDDKVYKPNDIYNRISKSKNNLITAESYTNNPQIITQDKYKGVPELYKIYSLYSSRCRTADAMDFDDLLLYTNILFRDNPDVLSQYQSFFSYILVDEYQDTNYAQYLIIKKMAMQHNNICVVGDDAQSIYSFRGAKIENILNFRNDYPNYHLHKLEQNYRSTQCIVNGANNLIASNSMQIPKKVFSENEEGNKIKVIKTASDVEESFVIAKNLIEVIDKYGVNHSEIAILYRTNAQSRLIEDALRRRNIPYKIYGGLSFYQRREIKDLLAYFRLIINSNDNEALKRIINIPARGIGKTSLEKLEKLSNNYLCSIWQIINNNEILQEHFNSGTINKLNLFASLIKIFQSKIETTNAFELATEILQKSNLLSEYENESKMDFESRKQNIEELLNSIYDYVSIVTEETGADIVLLNNYIENVSLLTDLDLSKKEEKDTVSLMTVHSAKGLEYDCVFIVGAEKDFFPLYLNSSTPAEIEEERRLFYVALTRAKKYAYITWAQTRMKWGKTVPSSQSIFIKEIGEDYLDLPPEINTYPQNDLFSQKKSFNDINKKIPTFAPKQEKAFKRISEIKSFNAEEEKNFSTFVKGTKVYHDRFGNGIVVSIEGDVSDIKAEIEFENSGRKKLLLKFAKLKILQ